MNSTSSTEITHSERAVTAHEQADSLASLATELRNNGAAGRMQLNHIADSLRENRDDVLAVLWLADELTEALKEDGTPMTREEVTSGYVNPSQERLNAWADKQALTR